MVYFQTKHTNFGNIFKGLSMDDVGIFNGHWYILRPFDILDGHLVYFVVIWYIFTRFGMLYQEKSGNPG
jgi:hypothetical protein